MIGLPTSHDSLVDEIDIIQELNNIKNWYNLVAPSSSIKFNHEKGGSVKLQYNIPTIHWTNKIYCYFDLIYWGPLFIYYQNLSLILKRKEIYQFTEKLSREWSIIIQGFKNY